jgi:diguanylate cyclase (GGDEF)-like protein
MMGPRILDGDIRIGSRALEHLMPMHLILAEDGTVTGAGPTLTKLFPHTSLVGNGFFQLFAMRRPRRISTIRDLVAHAGQRLYLAPRGTTGPSLRGTSQMLGGGQGLLINLSFGIGVIEAVRNHALTDADFAPTDLTVELLYVTEAKSAVMAELHRVNFRLNGARAEAEERALTDTLTGLGNRRALDRALERMTLHVTSFGLMSMDLDFFKQVNDRLGHAAGDHVLRHVAGVLRDETRERDVVARVGGDEFIILLPGLADKERLMQIASRIIDRVSQPIPFDGKLCQIAASVGVTISSSYHRPDPDQMIADADAALYAAKRAGRAQACAHTR